MVYIRFMNSRFPFATPITCRLLIMCSLVFSARAYSQDVWKKEKEELIASSADFKECHASTIVEYAPGKLLAAWFGGTREGNKDVTIWLTRFENGKWSKTLSV